MRELDERVLRAVEPIPGLALLVLFGSRARGRSRPRSDLDVALLPSDPGPHARRRLQSRVAVALAEFAPEGRVDVVFLDEAPVLLRQRIMEEGRVVLNRDPAAWREWRVRTMREHGDSEWARRLYRSAQRRRLEEEEPHGRSGRAFRSLERARWLPR